MASVSSSPESLARLGVLLNHTTLRLSDSLRTVRLGAEGVAVKYEPGARQLVLTARQWDHLHAFESGRTVPAALVELLVTERGFSLAEFYPLVTRAVENGILQAEGYPVPPAISPSRWPVKVPGVALRWLTPLLAVVAVVLLVLRPAPPPDHAGWLALGWLVQAVAVSLGWMLAASVVRAGGGEVYRARFHWRTLLPGFRADLSDAIMGGRRLRLDAALARLAPVLLALAVAAFWYPALLLPLLAGWLAEMSPLWPSPVSELLAARFRDSQLATTFGFELVRTRLITLLVHARRQLADWRYLFAASVATVGWLLLVLAVVLLLLQTNAVDLWHRFQSAGVGRYTALTLLGALAAAGVAVIAAAGAILASHVRSWWRERAERKQRPQAVLVSAQKIADWLGGTLLFRSLTPADLDALAAVVKPEEFRRGAFVVREGEPGDRLYVVLSGRLEVRRDYAPGRSEPVAELGEGEIFGEIALLEGGVRTRSVRALARSTLLSVGREEFERLVLTRLTRGAVLDEIQKVGFLQHVELTRRWHATALTEFARRSQLRELPEGMAVTQAGERNPWFFLVHRGELVVQLAGRELRRLKTGDSFGELSLLGDGLATSTVVVRSKQASCLVIAGRDFLELVAADFASGLQWEKLRARRVEPAPER
jgi:CRP-like cAMP-binding protein